MKLSATRPVTHIDTLISPTQSAIMYRRCIYENFKLIEGITKTLHKRKISALLLKLDISKAFETLSWDFPLEVLQVCGFEQQW